MKLLSVSEAREKLPQILDKVYFSAEKFVITKRGIPMAEIKTTSPILKTTPTKATTKAAAKFFGLWKDRWVNKTTDEIVTSLRVKAWNSHAA